MGFGSNDFMWFLVLPYLVPLPLLEAEEDVVTLSLQLELLRSPIPIKAAAADDCLIVVDRVDVEEELLESELPDTRLV